MSRHHVPLLRTIPNDPPSANLHWCEIESFLRHVGPLIVACLGGVKG